MAVCSRLPVKGVVFFFSLSVQKYTIALNTCHMNLQITQLGLEVKEAGMTKKGPIGK